MKYVVYEVSTGRIIRTGECAPNDLALQARSGLAVMETPEAATPGQNQGRISDATHKVVGGRLVRKTAEEIEADRPAHPAPGDEIAIITQKQWQAVLVRLNALEGR